MVSILAPGCLGFDSQKIFQWNKMLILINGADLRKLDSGLIMLIKRILFWPMAS